jgi:hypothetical protein
VLVDLQVIGFALPARFGPMVVGRMEERQAELRRADEAAENASDKSNDAAEAEWIQKAIGMPHSRGKGPLRDS